MKIKFTILLLSIFLVACSKTLLVEDHRAPEPNNNGSVIQSNKDADNFIVPSKEYSNKNLNKFPNEVLLNKNIVVLDLSYNKIKSIPSEIGELSKLKILNLSFNSLTGSLPGEIRKMPNLKELNASNNNLTAIPAEIGQLNNLENIDFSNNYIDSFPLEIANIKNNLKNINISNNNFTSQKLIELEKLLPSTKILK